MAFPGVEEGSLDGQTGPGILEGSRKIREKHIDHWDDLRKTK